MANKYKQPSIAGATRFSKSPMAEVEFSKMIATPRVLTTWNAGDIVPIYCAEVLPHSTFEIDLDFVARLQSAVIKPTLGTMQMDIYAYFVPNRIINDSWKNVQGENTSGAWTAPEVDLAPLYPLSNTEAVSIPVGSVADYYGFPTQAPILAQHLHACNDLRFKGYLSIYNSFFRDQNYENPVPFSTLNVYQGFLDPKDTTINLKEKSTNSSYLYAANGATDGSYYEGAANKALFGEGSPALHTNSAISPRVTNWSALDKPLKANKLHDAFTSVLPSPQKGPQVFFGVGDKAPIDTDAYGKYALSHPIIMGLANPDNQTLNKLGLTLDVSTIDGVTEGVLNGTAMTTGNTDVTITDTNLYAKLSEVTGVSVNDLRMAVATQQVYEALSRGGSRYLSMLRQFFEIEVDNPFEDIPTQLGHIRRELDLYQVAQTSATESGNTPQGDLAAFGYTSTGGSLFKKTFLEHGYIHILAVVRHQNLYSTYLAPDNFRKSTLDFYLPQFANIGEQPIALRTLNPFIADDSGKTLGFQEAWWEYRYEPDRVSGMLRSGLNNGLDTWNYADPYDAAFEVVNQNWLKSNSQEVLDRTLAVTSAVADQFLGMFAFKVTKQLPMPTYSVPGLDTI